VSEPGSDIADPAEQERVLSGILGLRLAITEVRSKFKYGGNVDDEHRTYILEQLNERSGPGDAAASTHLQRRTPLA
jgi:transcriptional regulator